MDIINSSKGPVAKFPVISAKNGQREEYRLFTAKHIEVDGKLVIVVIPELKPGERLSDYLGPKSKVPFNILKD